MLSFLCQELSLTVMATARGDSKRGTESERLYDVTGYGVKHWSRGSDWRRSSPCPWWNTGVVPRFIRPPAQTHKAKSSRMLKGRTHRCKKNIMSVSWRDKITGSSFELRKQESESNFPKFITTKRGLDPSHLYSKAHALSTKPCCRLVLVK